MVDNCLHPNLGWARSSALHSLNPRPIRGTSLLIVTRVCAAWTPANSQQGRSFMLDTRGRPRGLLQDQAVRGSTCTSCLAGPCCNAPTTTTTTS
eukprot:21497-Chlamydomonas_euryale.AAC.1